MATVERVSMHEAAVMLGVSHSKIWRLVKEGTLQAEVDPLDRRKKFIRTSDIERLKSDASAQHRPWPRSIGMVDLGIQSDQIEDWLEAEWGRREPE